MEVEEYKLKLTAIRNEALENEKLLNREYAKSNRKYTIGDIISDSNGSIKIDKYGIDFDSNRLPVLYYLGTELNKTLEPKKKHSTRAIWPSNICEPIKKSS